MSAPRICDYRHCDVDLDERGMRPQAKFCGTPHRAAEYRLRRAEAGGSGAGTPKPFKTVSTGSRRRNRRGSGTDLYVVAEEARYVRAAIRGGKRPRLQPAQRRRLQAKVDRVVERLAA